MSEPATPAPVNGTIVGAARDVSKQLIGTLPAQFIMLVLMNCIFLGLVFWYEHQTQLLRADAIGKLLDRCLVKAETFSGSQTANLP